MMLPVDSWHAAGRDTIRRAFAHTRYAPRTLLTGDFTGKGSNIGEGGGKGRSTMVTMMKASGGGSIIAGQGDVVSVDIVMDGWTMTMMTTMAIGCGRR